MNAIRFFANKSYVETDPPMDAGHKLAQTTLFELHLGLIDIGNGQAVWGGSLQDINSGEKHFFKGWPGLVTNLQEILTPSAQLEVLRALMRIREA